MSRTGAAAGALAVHLAWAPSSAPPADDGWLTAAERDALAALRRPKRAGDWRLGRWVAKEAVRRALGTRSLPGSAVEILAGPGGGPVATVVGGGMGAETSLSLSHSAGMGFAAAARGTVPLGCDVEAALPRSDAFVSDYLTVAEADWVEAAPAGERDPRANLVWSAKESALKALGEGLRLDTRSVEVTVADAAPRAGPWRPLHVAAPGGRALHGFWRATPGFVWTVVADAPHLRLAEAHAAGPGPGRPAPD